MSSRNREIRDNFSSNTKHRLAMRAGFRCSMSGCSALTAGPSDEKPDGIVNVGVAAHIHAAAPNGRRYDQNMTTEERMHIQNGIWLCSTHSVEIDRDAVRYTPKLLKKMKIEHEQAIALQLNTGNGAFRESDLIAIGPDIVGVGELLGTSGKEWSVQLFHFVEGDLRKLIAFSEQFDAIDPLDKYIIVNALGDGRQLASALSWHRDGSSVNISCKVESKFQTVDANRLEHTLATNDFNDLFVKNGDLATISGLDSLPQRIKGALSLQLGESPFYPKLGSRIKEYFNDFEDSLWLQQWIKLEVIRLSCIPYKDPVLNTTYTVIPSVLSVDNVEQVDSEKIGNWRDFKFKLNVEGVGPWEQVIPIFVPENDIQTLTPE